MDKLADPEETAELKGAIAIEPEIPEKKTSLKNGLGMRLNRIIIKHSPHSSAMWKLHKKGIITFLVLIALTVHCVFGIMLSGFEKSKDLFGVLVFSCVIVVYVVIRDTFGKQINVLVIKPVGRKIEDHWTFLKWYVLLKFF